MNISIMAHLRTRFLEKLFKRISGKKRIQSISVEELRDRLGSGEAILLLDLRHPLELLPDPRFIPGSIHVRPQDLVPGRMTISKESTVVFYCASDGGGAARHATEQLHRRGLRNFLVLEGGYRRWRDLGLPLEAHVAVAPTLSRNAAAHTAAGG